MKMNTSKCSITAVMFRCLVLAMAMTCGAASAGDGVAGVASQSVTVASCPQCVRCCSNATQAITALSATVTQLTERVRVLESQSEKVNIVLKMFQEEMDRPVVVDWLEGDAGTNIVLNNPAHATGKPAPGR